VETRRFWNTDMLIMPIGLGLWAIGGGNREFAWGPQDEREPIHAIERAIDLGMNWIDTAAVYGLGWSEELVGQAVRGMTHKPFIFTICDVLLTYSLVSKMG
jgi:aryl-alcohol dehydrogenase-like predicted oxidoreductase